MALVLLQQRLVSLQKASNQLKGSIGRLARLEPTALAAGGREATEDDEGGLRDQTRAPPPLLLAEDRHAFAMELGVEIGHALREQEDDLDLLLEEVEDLTPADAPGPARTSIQQTVAKLTRDLESHRVMFREAQLTAQRKLVQIQRHDRKLILQSYLQPPPTSTPPPDGERSGPRRRARPEPDVEDAGELGATGRVTAALREMHDMMAGEVAKSGFAQQTLDESTEALRQLDRDYGSVGSLVVSSTRLVGTLLRSQKSDTWYLQTAVYLLAATLAWLVFRRLLYGPLWWFVWVPVRLLVGSAAWVGGAVLYAARPSSATDAMLVSTGGAAVVSVTGLPDESLPTAIVTVEGAPTDDGWVGEILDGGGPEQDFVAIRRDEL